MESELTLPILDSLIDTKEQHSSQSYGFKLRQIKESLRRDLINLFNCRESPCTPARHHIHLQSSLLNYGLPDLMSINLNSKAESAALCQAIEDAVTRFEPRISSVKVTVKGLPDPLEPEFYFRIEVVLNVAIAEELIVFDSALNPITSDVNVTEAPHYE